MAARTKRVSILLIHLLQKVVTGAAGLSVRPLLGRAFYRRIAMDRAIQLSF